MYVLKNVSERHSFWGAGALARGQEVWAAGGVLGDGDVRGPSGGRPGHQLGQTLPSFCRWAEDAAEGFRLLAKPLGAALQNRRTSGPMCATPSRCWCPRTPGRPRKATMQDFGGGVGSDSGLSDDGNGVGAGEDD